MTLQPPPAQTMVQALELLYALGGKMLCCQNSRKVQRETVVQLQDKSVRASTVQLRCLYNLCGIITSCVPVVRSGSLRPFD